MSSAAETQEQIGAHLITCTECSDEFCGADRGTGEYSPATIARSKCRRFLWTRVAAHTVVESNDRKGWLAQPLRDSVYAIRSPRVDRGVVVRGCSGNRLPGVEHNRIRDPSRQRTTTTDPIQATEIRDKQIGSDNSRRFRKQDVIASTSQSQTKSQTNRQHACDQSGCACRQISAYLDMDDQDTARHIEQTQNLLRSIKNVRHL